MKITSSKQLTWLIDLVDCLIDRVLKRKDTRCSGDRIVSQTTNVQRGWGLLNTSMVNDWLGDTCTVYMPSLGLAYHVRIDVNVYLKNSADHSNNAQ